MMQKTGPDSLMGWLVALMICFIATMMYGTAGLSSMMFVACITRYDTDRNQASFPFILSYVIQATTGNIFFNLVEEHSLSLFLQVQVHFNQDLSECSYAQRKFVTIVELQR